MKLFGLSLKHSFYTVAVCIVLFVRVAIKNQLDYGRKMGFFKSREVTAYFRLFRIQKLTEKGALLGVGSSKTQKLGPVRGSRENSRKVPIFSPIFFFNDFF